MQDTSGSMTFSTEASLSGPATTTCATHNGDSTGAACNADTTNSCVWTGCGPVTGTCTAAISGQGAGCLSQYCGSHYTAGTTNMAACNADVAHGCRWTITNPISGSGECTTLNTCGHPHTRMSDAKCALENVLSAYGDAEFGLETYNTTCSAGSCTVGTCDQGDCGFSSCTTTCDATAASGLMRVPIGQFGASSSYSLVDYSCAGSTTALPTELFTAGQTPLGGSLVLAKSYFQNGATINGTAFPSPLAGDGAHSSCRPVSVILLTDGLESCTGSAATAATSLRSTAVAGAGTWNIKTYVIGLGVSDPTTLNAIASAGGTNTAYSVSDDATIASAFSSIIASSVLVEVCNGSDDDCDMAVDEGFTLYCNFRSGSPNYPGGPAPTPTLCANPGEVCDGVDNNCDGRIDEGVLNACGACGTVPAEVCDGIDNNCNGIIDDGITCPCVPDVEVCNNRDDDCDMIIDEMITRACGANVGICTTGTQACTAGMFGPCSGTQPQAQQCNGMDNNCDGAVDRPVQPCGSSVGACVPGTQACNPATHMFGACVGGVGPRMELCNGIDDDCDGTTDEGDPGGGGACGSTVGSCSPGIYHCVAGMLTCTGGSSGTAEVCNAADDDCDGVVDEGIPSGGTCGPPGTNNIGQCMLGQLLCVNGMPNTCVGAVGPSAEVCDNIDNNCNGSTDEGNPGGGMPCGISVGICMPGTTMCVSGMIQCLGSTGPMTEVCNARDDDCDTIIDEGIPVGAPCGSSIGECMPGSFVCDPMTGMLVCSGAHGPMTEICDTLDNDCDGIVDEDTGGGGPCGVMAGICRQGVNECVNGAITCVGAITPTPEVCDCLDNDCNGTVDNPPMGGSLCPTGSSCVDCTCAPPCVHTEFGDRCPSGTSPMQVSGTCFCIPAPCDATSCATEMHGTGTTACSPTTNPCVCRGDTCTYACDGVACTGGLVCDPRDGSCQVNDCLHLGVCPAGRECNLQGACVADPCASVTCGSNQACRSGVCDGMASHCCFATCAGVTCPGTQVCHDGTCEPGCTGVTCPASNTCDPATGMCVINTCSGVSCPTSTSCDPLTGTCRPTDACAGVHCPAMTICRMGECVTPPTVDAGVDASIDAGGDAGIDAAHIDGGRDAGGDGSIVRSDGGNDTGVGFDAGDRQFRDLVAGGGCVCTVGVGADRSSDRRHQGVALLGAALVVTLLRRRRGGAR